MFRISDFGFRIYGKLLPLALLLLASWQFSASASPTKSRELAAGRVGSTGGHAKVFCVARTDSIAPDGDAYSPVAASSSTPTESRELATGRVRPTGGHAKAIPLAKAFGVDGIDWITSEKQEKQPAPDGGNSPDSSSDIEDSDADLDDLRADLSTRNDQDTPHFSVTGLDAVALRTPRIVPILLFPVHCFYCLHEHIRERAPPIPV